MAKKKINLKVIAILIAGIIGYGVLLSALEPFFKEKPKAKEEQKVLYVPADITKKYPEEFKDKKELLVKIKSQISKETFGISDNKEKITNYKDSKERVVYKMEEKLDAVKNFLGGKSGYSFKRYYPDEEGYLYDENGRVVKILEIKNTYEGFYYVSSEDDRKRRSYFENEETGGMLIIKTIIYDEKGNKIREEMVKPRAGFEKEIIDYRKDGKKKSEKKIIDNEMDSERYSKIYVEITKEYDANEKLIKKFVLRKNKHNAVRSETNFDLIKGEIVTKYYDGDKAFATVTETLIGKDRAIVKREREGDEFVIWDFVEYEKYGAKMNKYFVKNDYIEYELRNTKYLISWTYNDDEKGINNLSYRYEIFFYRNMEEDSGVRLSESGEIYEYTIEENIARKKKIEFDKKGEKTYFPDEVYIIEKNYREKYKNKTNIIENVKLEKEKIKFNNTIWR